MSLILYVIDDNGEYNSCDGKLNYKKLIGKEAYAYLNTNEAKGKRFYIEKSVGIEIQPEKESVVRKYERHKQYIQDLEEKYPYEIISLHILIPDREYTTEDVLADEGVNVHKSAIYNILVEDLYKGIDTLTVLEKYVIEALFLKTPVKKQCEIAKELGVSQQAISKIVCSAKKKLKKFLEKWL